MQMRRFAICAVLVLWGCSAGVPPPPLKTVTRHQALILESVQKQAEDRALYSAGYVKLAYPGGDVPKDRGACTDVVVRALRNAGYDLQKLIHEDMKVRFKTYPRREAKPDRNIDHRRCPNQIHYFKKFGQELTIKTDKANLKHWQPGDIVYWKLPSGLDHTGILTDNRNRDGVPLVVHNLGACQEEDVLEAWKIVGHYRFPKR